MDNSSNDNGTVSRDISDADAYGYAALAFTKSLIHSLSDDSLIDPAEANNIFSIAIYATQTVFDDLPARSGSPKRSISLLTDIRHSLRNSA